MEVSPETRMGAVELTVADLDRTLDYWTSQIGLRVLSRENGRASLGTDTEVLRFVEEPGARPDTGHTGLYHVALLVPDRPSLARWLAHAARDRVSLTGLSDHAVSEAIYLRDPDGYEAKSSSTGTARIEQIPARVIADAGAALALAA